MRNASTASRVDGESHTIGARREPGSGLDALLQDLTPGLTAAVLSSR